MTARQKKLVKVKINQPVINMLIKSFSPGGGGGGGGKGSGSLQRFIDMEVIRLSDPYVPSDTTALRKSVYMNSDIGSGRLVYTIYGNPDGRNTWNDDTSLFQDRPKRGSRWTARMLLDGGGEKLLMGIKRFMGG